MSTRQRVLSALKAAFPCADPEELAGGIIPRGIAPEAVRAAIEQALAADRREEAERRTALMREYAAHRATLPPPADGFPRWKTDD